LREILFARVTQRAVRRIALEVFPPPAPELSLRFHLQRQTGGVSRDIERGSRSISSLISYTLYSILPTLVEITLVLIDPAGQVRQCLCPDHPGFADGLCGIHGQGQQLADRHSPETQRNGLGSKYSRHRQPAQLRNGQILQQ
jgi:hypothetical protein